MAQYIFNPSPLSEGVSLMLDMPLYRAVQSSSGRVSCCEDAWPMRGYAHILSQPYSSESPLYCNRGTLLCPWKWCCRGTQAWSFSWQKSNRTLAAVFKLCGKSWYFPVGVLSHFVPGQETLANASCISCCVGFLKIACPITLSSSLYNALITSGLKYTFFPLIIT